MSTIQIVDINNSN